MNKIKFPALNVKMVDINKVMANDYNPNFVAKQEYELLIHSISEDGLTQPIVAFHNKEKDEYIIVDGFHRYKVLRDYFKCSQIPIVVIDKPLRERMASTIRHNRARGKHRVDLQAELIKSLLHKGWKDSDIAKHLGMTEEEIIRFKQIVGIAKIFSNSEYSKSWGEEKNEMEIR